jgi:hypothetical protein
MFSAAGSLVEAKMSFTASHPLHLLSHAQKKFGRVMKVLIQGLGEVPATVEFAIEKEKPDVTYIFCSQFQMRSTATSCGYKRPSKDVIERTAKRFKTKVVWRPCDIFDVKSIGEALTKTFKEIKPTDEVLVNYTGGAASVKLLLGVSAILLSRKIPIKIIYALRYKAGTEIYINQTDDLKEIFKRFQRL